jgi:hypothetical protein
VSGDDDDPWNRPTQRDGARDIHFRHGLLMGDVARLADRVDALERIADRQAHARRSMRPAVERIGVSAVVAGIVAGIVQGLAQLLR